MAATFDSPAGEHHFAVSRLREWAVFVLPAAMGLLTAEFLYSAPSFTVFLSIGGMAALVGLLEALRPRREVVVSTTTLSAPRGWSGSVSLPLPAAPRAPSLWQRLNGLRVVRAQDGRSVTLNAFVLGRAPLARILTLIAA